MRRILFTLLMSVSAASFMFAGCDGSTSDESDQDYGIQEGELQAGDALSKADSVGIAGLPVSADDSDTAVWEVRNQWEDTDTPEARKAGPAWSENSGLTWDEKYARWIASMRRIPSDAGYYDTFELVTPWGKKVPAPVLECAELAIFLRVTFASWYGLPFYLEAVDGSGTRVYFGHFGARTKNGRYRKTPLFRKWYRDYTSQFTGKDDSYIEANWPHDSKLRSRGLYGGGDEQTFLGEGLRAGAYFDEIFLNKRVGYFLLLSLTYFGSTNLVDSRNTYNLVPDALRTGDILLERWQRRGIGHTLVVKTVDQLEGGKLQATLVSGSMPRRQPKWEDSVQSKEYFTSSYTGGEGENWDGEPYYKLGGGLKRWRVAKNVNGRWMNTWMKSDESSWINDTDYDRIKERPSLFEELLGDVDPQQMLEALVHGINDARNHLRNYPASCAARERREAAFERLYEFAANNLGMTRYQVDVQYRTLDDYVFAELVYQQSKTCCWNSSTNAMYQIIMDYNRQLMADAAANDQCAEPVVFKWDEGYDVFKNYAEATGRGHLWREWSADESCPQADVQHDTEREHGWTDWCDLPRDQDATHTGDASDNGNTGCQDDPLEDNDSMDSARPVSAGNYNDLAICEEDSDWFEIDASQVSRVSISFTHANGDLDMKLYDSNGSRIDSSESTGDQESIELSSQGITSGTYYVEVYGYDGATNSYSLSVEQ